MKKRLFYLTFIFALLCNYSSWGRNGINPGSTKESNTDTTRLPPGKSIGSKEDKKDTTPVPVIKPTDDKRGEDGLPTQPAKKGGDEPHDTSRREVFWYEYGDGAFTKNGVYSPRSSRHVYDALMLTAVLYDTTKDGLSKLTQQNYQNGLVTPTTDNDIALTGPGSPVTITPSILSVMRQDTMVFAVSYKVPESNTANTTHQLIFFYNSAVFEKLTSNPDVPGTDFKTVRVTHEEPIQFPATLSSSILNNVQGAGDYDSYIVFDVVAGGFSEKNVFITLRPLDSAAIGTSGSVKAVLVQADGSVVGSPASVILPIEKAHDPNYITQQKHCILTAKTNTLINYHVHFQNDGMGTADEVRVKISLPAKMKFTDFNFISASVGGITIRAPKFRQIGNSDSVIFFFPGVKLYGTRHNPSAASDPKTMGDIFFTLKSNKDFADTIYSRAAIYFHSDGAKDTEWEDVVLTQPAMSYFTTAKCCDCKKPIEPKPGDKSRTNFQWWWIIVAAGLIILILIIWRRRKKKEVDEPNHG